MLFVFCISTFIKYQSTSTSCGQERLCGGWSSSERIFHLYSLIFFAHHHQWFRPPVGSWWIWKKEKTCHYSLWLKCVVVIRNRFTYFLILLQCFHGTVNSPSSIDKKLRYLFSALTTIYFGQGKKAVVLRLQRDLQPSPFHLLPNTPSLVHMSLIPPTKALNSSIVHIPWDLHTIHQWDLFSDDTYSSPPVFVLATILLSP